MGYSLTIGEAEILSYDEDGLESDCRVTAKGAKRDDAPAFGEPTDYTSERWPSYTAWWDFCEFVGLTDAMYIDGGNMRGGHPGAFPINKEFKLAVDQAMERLRMQYPEAVASYGGDKSNIPEENGAMCRLSWLQYWTDWALENCKSPVFANS